MTPTPETKVWPAAWSALAEQARQRMEIENGETYRMKSNRNRGYASFYRRRAIELGKQLRASEQASDEYARLWHRDAKRLEEAEKKAADWEEVVRHIKAEKPEQNLAALKEKP